MSRRNPISQREARRLKKQVEALEQRHRAMVRNWLEPYSGVHLITFNELTDYTKGALTAATRLDQVLVARLDNGKLQVYALRAP